jgi:lipopolysaccharide export system protein LptC
MKRNKAKCVIQKPDKTQFESQHVRAEVFDSTGMNMFMLIRTLVIYAILLNHYISRKAAGNTA